MEDLYIDSELKVEPKVNTGKEFAKTILIVEDNADMRKYIKDELKHEYNIIEASNGEEGIKQSVFRIPDLIVSDVMMPNMNGIEFCRQIKSNIKTSHIPVILLTAKVDIKTKYDGIETGADDFIPKPFKMEYLLIRIKNLLHSREQLRKLFQSSTVLEPSEVTVNSIDETFLSSLMEVIEKGIPDSSFTAKSIESDMGMSHAFCYRKIKSLTGLSGQELLQTMRMKRARQVLLQNKGLNISEVAYMVGFTNPNYFSKCFKNYFGDTPTSITRK